VLSTHGTIGGGGTFDSRPGRFADFADVGRRRVVSPGLANTSTSAKRPQRAASWAKRVRFGAGHFGGKSRTDTEQKKSATGERL